MREKFAISPSEESCHKLHGRHCLGLACKQQELVASILEGRLGGSPENLCSAQPQSLPPLAHPLCETWMEVYYGVYYGCKKG